MDLPFYDCVLCTTLHEETPEHLFLHRHSAQACWATLHLVVQLGDPFQILDSFQLQLNTYALLYGQHYFNELVHLDGAE
jgi:hypothetical protein